MIVGCQTILWGTEIPDIERLLDNLVLLGFRGIEIAQTPHSIRCGSEGIDYSKLQNLLAEREMSLIGLSGGTLKERMRFCQGDTTPYLYTEMWGDEANEATKKGYTLALHPHLFKPIYRMGHAEALLEDNPDLRIILDSAHLTIAGDDLTLPLKIAGPRIISVHLKDWKPEYGRYSHRYARGFTELGKGIIPLDSLIERLDEIGYDGWLIWEQDSTRFSPEESAYASAMWLHERGLIEMEPQFPKIRPPDTTSFPRVLTGVSPILESQLMGALRTFSGKPPQECYNSITRALSVLLGYPLVTMWRCTASQELMTLQGSSKHLEFGSCSLNYKDLLSGVAIATREVQSYDLTVAENMNRVANPHVLESLNIDRMVSVPVLNPWNINHVMCVVIFFGAPDIMLSDSDLFSLGCQIGMVSDSVTSEQCAVASGNASFVASNATTSNSLFSEIRSVIKEIIQCETCAIFEADRAGSKLTCSCPDNTTWSVSTSEQFYLPGEGLTGFVWQSGEPLLTPNAHEHENCLSKSFEGVVDTQNYNCLLFPLTTPSGKVLGVVRCRHKKPSSIDTKQNASFSDDDVAVLDAINQAIMPYFVLLAEQEHRAAMLGRLTHELKTPLVAIRGAAETLLESRRFKSSLAHEPVKYIWSWSELMRRLLTNLNAVRSEDIASLIKVRPTFLLKHVIKPAVDQVELLLMERNIRPESVEIIDLKLIPALDIDPNLFQQVAFNLLTNAIKHSYDDANNFDVEIRGVHHIYKNQYTLVFRDWGPGIELGMEEFIFEEGVRGASAIERDVKGEGLGLWVVRQILEAHGCSILVTHRDQPTEFTITIPGLLRSDGKPSHVYVS